ncbi:MAG: imidazole glycerol phosphate synthase subunit HisH [Candidatus Micrarchaeota archaeon]|nr:imidazole glycerol phosphate synthase subunit HisH [Candidatus Micrarchaeota archaeon]
MIAIIDYGAGNPGSVRKAFEFLGEKCVVTSSPEDVIKADRIIFPGVGSFGEAIKTLRKKGLDEVIKNAVGNGTPFLGICLGLQLLFEESEESPGVKGLCLLEGRCVRFREGKVPEIGWNEVKPVREGSEILGSGGFAYFVNSFYVAPADEEIKAGVTEYGIEFTSAVKKGNVFAVQFHPEKSGKYGLEVLRRWLSCSQKE